MKAGRELDALIAEKVMGFEVQDGNVVRDNKRSGIPPYSRDMNFTWQVVEKFDFAKIERVTGYGQFYKVILSVAQTDGIYKEVEEQADTAPLAICLVALKAVGVEVDC